MTNYLQEVEDLELRLQLATEVEVFDVGIEVGLFLWYFSSLMTMGIQEVDAYKWKKDRMKPHKYGVLLPISRAPQIDLLLLLPTFFPGGD